jgi:hypothetical protein
MAISSLENSETEHLLHAGWIFLTARPPGHFYLAVPWINHGGNDNSDLSFQNVSSFSLSHDEDF